MRNKSNEIVKILISDDDFNTVSRTGHSTVKIIEILGNPDTITRMDFIVFLNPRGETILKQYWDLDKDYIEYTSIFAENSDDILLEALCCVIYSSIQQIRTHSFLNNIRKYLRFSKDKVVHETRIICLCVDFLQGGIDTNTFIECIRIDEHFTFKSLLGILDEYTLNYDKINKEVLDNLKSEAEYIRKCTSSMFEWGGIYKRAYSKHNIPYELCFGV